MQTDAAFFANNSQHCWMLHVASVCTSCCVLLGVVAQSLKPVKLLNEQLPTFRLFRDRRSVAQQCWIRLHLTLLGLRTRITHGLQDLWVVSFPRCTTGPNIVGSFLHKTDATTPKIVGPTMLGVVASVYT